MNIDEEDRRKGTRRNIECSCGTTSIQVDSFKLNIWKAIKMKVMVICYNYVINQTQTQESFKFC